jgi:hypothetical protein
MGGWVFKVYTACSWVAECLRYIQHAHGQLSVQGNSQHAHGWLSVQGNLQYANGWLSVQDNLQHAHGWLSVQGIYSMLMGSWVFKVIHSMLMDGWVFKIIYSMLMGGWVFKVNEFLTKRSSPWHPLKVLKVSWHYLSFYNYLENSMRHKIKWSYHIKQIL